MYAGDTFAHERMRAAGTVECGKDVNDIFGGVGDDGRQIGRYSLAEQVISGVYDVLFEDRGGIEVDAVYAIHLKVGKARTHERQIGEWSMHGTYVVDLSISEIDQLRVARQTIYTYHLSCIEMCLHVHVQQYRTFVAANARYFNLYRVIYILPAVFLL